MPSGTVKFFNRRKGFGFIIPEDGSKDVFVHYTASARELNEGDKVSYELEETEKGLSAVKVEIEE